MVIHVIFAFASARHNGTPSRCSSVTVITTPRASVGMRSEFDITASFIIRANVKWLIHQKAARRFQGRGFISNLQTPARGNVALPMASQIWDFVLKEPNLGGPLNVADQHRFPSACVHSRGSHVSKPTWGKRTFAKRCSAASRFCCPHFNLRAHGRSWASTGRAIICVSKRTRRGGTDGNCPSNTTTTTTIDRQ